MFSGEILSDGRFLMGVASREAYPETMEDSDPPWRCRRVVYTHKHTDTSFSRLVVYNNSIKNVIHIYDEDETTEPCSNIHSQKIT